MVATVPVANPTNPANYFANGCKSLQPSDASQEKEDSSQTNAPKPFLHLRPAFLFIFGNTKGNCNEKNKSSVPILTNHLLHFNTPSSL